jgi:arabinogalactan endo-1,4-beta-galactosidase
MAIAMATSARLSDTDEVIGRLLRVSSLSCALGLAALCGCSSAAPGDGNAVGGAGGEVAGASAGKAQGGRASAAGSGAIAGENAVGGASAGGPGAGSGPGGSGGDGGGFVAPSFMLGADISSVQEAIDGGETYVDTDGEQKELLELLRGHGFNYVRLRSFVDPDALYGYANPTGDEQFRKAESYCDTQHTLLMAQQVKQAGMGLLLDLHYSDNWADPGKQVIPSAWRDAGSIDELAQRVEIYTKGVVQALVEGGARPDMVQLGNEITPGLLIHVPSENPEPDQWGNLNKLTNVVNGSTANFGNVAKLLAAGAAGVAAVDPSIALMLHVENTESFPAVRDYVNAVRSRGVRLDVLGLSCYTAFQGQPAIWQDTFQQLAQSLKDISFVIAEYNPEATRANHIMRDLPDGRGRGTFLWEPTQSGSWGSSLFTFVNGAQHANADAFAEFDALALELGL